MYTVTVKERELWDERNERFISIKEQTLILEHSLISVSNWESKWKIAFLSKNEKTQEQIIDYIKCMTINKVDPNVYRFLTQKDLDGIINYINDTHSASNPKKINNSPPSREPTTSELIYYWMFSFQIPIECEKWHLNRLMNLIQIFNIKNMPPKKRSKSQLVAERNALNAQRRAKYNTKG